MAQPIRSGRSLALLGMLFLVAACDQQTHLQSTVPAHNATGVPARTIIAVEISNTILESDQSAVDPDNFNVTGDLTQEPYRGTVALARRDELWPGMTVEDFNERDQQAPPPDNNGDGDSTDADEPEENTMVWLLETGVEFKTGEWIRVVVDSKVTAHGTPARSGKTWWFQIEEGDEASGDLRVTSTSPPAQKLKVPARPRIQASFNRAVDESQLEQGITIRGTHSGVHAGGSNVPTRTNGASRVLEVLHLLADDDSLVPGEIVDVTFASSITEAGTAQLPTATRLTPHHTRFQVESGLVTQGWTSFEVAGMVSSPKAILPADFKPLVPGVEIAVVGEEQVAIVEGLLESSPSRTLADIPLQVPVDTFHVVDAVAYDMESDGIPEVVVMLEGAGGSRLEIFELDDSGGLQLRDDPVDFPPLGLGGLSVADVDANGRPELFVSHPSRRYSPGPGQPLLNTGFLTMMDLVSVEPDPDDIDLGDPDSMLPTLQFESVATSLADLPQAQRIEAADLNGDGKLDLVFETAAGLKIQRNVGTPAMPYSFRAGQGTVAGRVGGVVKPLAWGLGDLDGDGDVDLLAWDAQGPLLYENVPEVPGSTPIATDQSVINAVWTPLALGPEMLDVTLTGRATVHVRDLDGDGIVDLVLAGENDSLTVARGRPGMPFAFDTLMIPGAAGGGPTAIADVDGDSGLDVVSIQEETESLNVLSSQGVQTPTPTVPSTFEFASEESGLTDLEGSTLRVAVLGNIEEPFAGYSISMEYDETVLEYKGFEAPSALATHQFTLCPDAQLQGCSGFATVSMRYRQGLGGKASGVLLGTFIFEKPEVSEAVTTELSLEAVDGANDSQFDNTLALSEGDATFDMPVTIQGSPLVLMLEPPAPPALLAECSVLERRPASLMGLVLWTSPGDVDFSRFEVSVGGGAPETLSAAETSYEFVTGLTGVIDVTVRGVPVSGEPVTATCEVVGIHRPTVNCTAVNETENLVTWTLSHGVESFVIYRNGVQRQTVNGAARQYSDRSPSTTGADNYEVAGVLLGEQGPRGSCEGGPVGDPDDTTTEPPSIRDAVLLSRDSPSDPNALRLRWTNGEGYDSISVSLERVGDTAPFFTKADLPGSTTEFVFEGDEDLGGVAPQKYIFSISGTTNLRESQIVRSSEVTVPVPALSVDFSCAVDADGRLVLAWKKPWQGFTQLELTVDHTVGGIPSGSSRSIPLDIQSTGYTLADISPIGTYTVELAATYDDPSLPPDLLPSAGLLTTGCTVRFDPTVLVEDVEGGLGQDLEIPVEADVLGEVRGFRFELELPDFLLIDGDPARGLRLEHGSLSNVQEFRIESSSQGFNRAVVELDQLSIPPDQDGDGVADGRKTLVTLLASVPLDFTLPRESTLSFTGSTTLEFASQGAVPVTTENGVLLLRHKFLALDTKDVVAGSQEVVPLRVRGTFQAPESNPEYRINAFQIHLKWDPDKLDLQPVTEADQAETVVAGKGSYILPTEATYETSRALGDLKVSWLGFDFKNPTEPDFLYPGVDMELLRVRFRSLVPGDSPGTFATVEFVTDASAELPTAIFPEIDDPTEPDLEGFFDGGIRVLSQDLPFQLDGISPSKGPLVGGVVAEVSGTGLVPSGTGPEAVTLRLRNAGSVDVTVASADILDVKANRIRFVVPASGLSNPAGSVAVDVQVTTPSGAGTLVAAYTYEYPQVLSFSPVSGNAGGGELLVLLGEGLPQSSTVTFEVATATRTAPVTGAQPDGTRLQVTTPDLRGFENQRATIRVQVPGIDTVIEAPGDYLILAGSGGPTLEIDSVTPAVATICGGTEVTLSGRGFLSDLQVLFGDHPADSVQVLDATTARVSTPGVPEGTGSVDIQVATQDQVAVEPDAFLFEHPAPPFLRGDATGDSRVNVSDAILIAELALGTIGVDAPRNLDAADVTDDGVINGGDVTLLMAHLFAGGEPLPPPVTTPGLDPTPDEITSCPP